MTNYSVFVVDDEGVAREGVTLALKREYQVQAFASAEAVIDALENDAPDLILLDIGLPGMSGVEALKIIKEKHPEIIVIMITAYEDVETVISAMKLGAYDYVVKPLKMDSLIAHVRVALETISMRKEIQMLHEKYLKENLPCFISESDAISDIMEIVKRVAESSDTSILIVGETGTGKELIAKAIHYRSPHFKGQIVSVNCAAIPKELIESELFGYEKGAFSGADASGKMGLVEKAADGTLFLDEVGDLSMAAQAKLLRFLEEGEYYRVGGTEKHRVRPRIVSATNRDLSKMIEDGEFREDLYYRLAVVKIEIPSLNQRPDDIIPIAQNFLLEFGRKFGKTFTYISPDAEVALQNYHWTGNVRELKNIVERAVLMSDGPVLKAENLELKKIHLDEPDIKPDDMPVIPPLSASGIDFTSILNSIEKYYFDAALKMADGNESRAASLLGLTRDKFRYRIKKTILMAK
ncbi:MAG: sigma-54 dependent transcriptional regulator [Desulfobacterales bacterium]|nr:sigma-54 dependent transcriptional regulator [Desulfobacterales bacterium]MDX2508359.1 sigma-54 dependent transcriptional regulator [Desulfobacterales bacterium]